MKITISEALSWQKILKTRHQELVALRNSNAQRIKENYNGHITESIPMYDAKDLDKQVALLAREMRLLDQAIKRANAKTLLDEYEQDDKVLGELA